MTLRSQTVAIAILVVVTGLVFVLVGNAGVSTEVFLPDPTLTPVPTITPSPTPLPEPLAENWTETTPGQLVYEANPEVTAQIAYEVTLLDAYIREEGLEPPAEDDQLPLLNILDQLRATLEEEATQLQLTHEPDWIEGPMIQGFDGVPVAFLRLTLAAQTNAAGQSYSGVDLVIGLIDRGNGEISTVQYFLQGDPDPVIYADFQAWLEDNAVELAGLEDEAEAEATKEAGDETPTPESTATEETQPEAEATEEVLPEATEEALPEATEEAAQPDVPEETWGEMSPGQLVYAADPQVYAQISYSAMQLDTLIEQAELLPPAEDAELPLLDILDQMRAQFEETIAQLGITLEPDGIEGPGIRVLDGVPVAFLRIVILPQIDASGQEVTGMDLVMALIDMENGNVNAIQYMLQGEPDPIVYNDFRIWLEDNAVKLATLEVDTEEETEPEAEETEEAPPEIEAVEDATPEATEVPSEE